MAIAVHCPHCQTAYRLAEDQAGKRVRCRGCRQTFDVPGPAAAPPPHVGMHRLDRPLGTLRPPSTVPPALPALPEALPTREPPPRREREPDEILPPADNRALLGVAAALGAAAVVVLLVCGGLGWYVINQTGRRVDRMVQQARQGQPPIPVPMPAEAPIVNEAEALLALSSPESLRRRRGAEWLGRQFPDRDPARRAEVRAALAPLLNDVDPAVRHAAWHATNVWR